MRCEVCGRDLNEIWQDNMADGQTYNILCEDCHYNYYGGRRNDGCISSSDDGYEELDGIVVEDIKSLIKKFERDGIVQIELKNNKLLSIEEGDICIIARKVDINNMTRRSKTVDYGVYYDIEAVFDALSRIGVLRFKD